MLHGGSAAVDRALLPTRLKLGNYNCRYRPKITVAAQFIPGFTPSTGIDPGVNDAYNLPNRRLNKE